MCVCVTRQHRDCNLNRGPTAPESSMLIGYRAALSCPRLYSGSLQLNHVWTADPSADGRRSAASRTAIVGGFIVSLPPERYLVVLCCNVVCLLCSASLEQSMNSSETLSRFHSRHAIHNTVAAGRGAFPPGGSVLGATFAGAEIWISENRPLLANWRLHCRVSE